MALLRDRFFVWAIFALIIFSIGCENRKALIDEPLYEGPMISMDNIFTKLSDSAKVVVILKARKQNEFENGDREWPDSLYLEYMDEEGTIVSTFRADYAFYTAKDDLYHAEGNVVVESLDNGDVLTTEELYWDPRKEEFYTDRFVTIQSDDEVHTGEGLTANQDFSTYKILKPQGTLLIDEQ